MKTAVSLLVVLAAIECFAHSNVVMPESFGAVGDRVSDDAAAIQKAIDSLSPLGGTVWLPKRYLIDSTDLLLKPNVVLKGKDTIVGNPGNSNMATEEEYTAQGGQIVLNPKYKIIMKGASGIKGVMFWRKGLKIPSLDGEGFEGTCIEVEGEDCYIGYSLILGFDQAVKSSKHQRMRVEFVQGDCTNGIWVDYTFDIVTITNCHFWPFTSVAAQKGFTRKGVAYKFTGASDMTKVVNCFSYDYMIGFKAENSAGMVFSYCNADSTAQLKETPPKVIDGSVGYHLSGYARNIRLIGCEAWGKEWGFVIEPTDVFDMGEKLLPVTLNSCKTELVLNGVKSNCDLMMNGCDIRGIGILVEGHYGTGLEIVPGSNAQIVGCRFIDFDKAIEKGKHGEFVSGYNRFIQCNFETVEAKE